MRERLPDRRHCTSVKAKVDGTTVHFSVGFYEDGRPGELFIDMAKQGSAVRTFVGAAAMLASMLLQHGAPLADVLRALRDTNSEDFGEAVVTGYPGIARCSGVLDFVAHAMEREYVGRSAE